MAYVINSIINAGGVYAISKSFIDNNVRKNFFFYCFFLNENFIFFRIEETKYPINIDMDSNVLANLKDNWIYILNAFKTGEMTVDQPNNGIYPILKNSDYIKSVCPVNDDTFVTLIITPRFSISGAVTVTLYVEEYDDVSGNMYTNYMFNKEKVKLYTFKP